MFHPYTVASVWNGCTSSETVAAGTGLMSTNRRASVSNASIAGGVGKSGCLYAKISSDFCPGKADLAGFWVSVMALRCWGTAKVRARACCSFTLPLSPIKRSIFTTTQSVRLAKIQSRRRALSGERTGRGLERICTQAIVFWKSLGKIVHHHSDGLIFFVRADPWLVHFLTARTLEPCGRVASTRFIAAAKS